VARLELKGIPVSPGVGSGPALVVVEAGAKNIPTRKLHRTQRESARELFENARQRAIQGLQRIQAATARELGIQDAAIYGAQIAVLQDPEALRSIGKMVLEDGLAPESAIQALLNRFQGLFESLEGGDIKNWAADLRDPWFAVIRELGDEEERSLGPGTDGRLVLVAEELTPSLVTRFPRGRMAAILCTRGGRFSHGAVLARSMGIPTIVGLEGLHQRVRKGELCVAFGEEGRVLLGALKRERAAAHQLARERETLRQAMEQAARQPCLTADGQAIKTMANIESPRDLKMFDPATVGGVGLFRTEFAYMERATFPSQKEQAEIYASVLDSFPGKPVVFRTLDIGGDKKLRYFDTPKELNPALGWRGIRVSLEWRDLFLMQVSALVQARRRGDVRILLPMVTTLEELRQARALVEEVQAQFKENPTRIPLGIMIEVPAAAMALRDLVLEADFLSVGTNDLVQYLFAVDRDNAWVSSLYQTYHPAHLRVLRYIARTCNLAGKPVCVCGEMAGEAAGALFLVGAGFRSLSMAPPFVPEIKGLLRQAPLNELEKLSSRAAVCATGKEARKLLDAAVERYWKRAVNRARDAAPGGA